MTRASDLARLIGAGATINDGTTITTADNDPQLTLISTDADENVGPEIDLYRNSASPADGDIVGRLVFNGENDAGEKIDYANIQFRIVDASDGTEDGRLLIVKKLAGADVGVMSSNNTETVFNDDSADMDFRVESGGDANMINIDGGNNNLGIGTVPDSNRKLHVKSARTGAFNTMIDMTASSGGVFALDTFFSGQAPDDNTSEYIRCRDTGAIRFTVFADGDTANHDNSYGSFSDVKLKEQITNASSQWDDIKALTIRKYKMKEDVAKGDSDKHWRLGVIAQELETAGMNGLVKNNPDYTENDDGEFVIGDTVTKSVKYSILYMKAVKALQEAMTRIETLEAKVTALESK